jgi:hypothetical protein
VPLVCPLVAALTGMRNDRIPTKLSNQFPEIKQHRMRHTPVARYGSRAENLLRSRALATPVNRPAFAHQSISRPAYFRMTEEWVP